MALVVLPEGQQRSGKQGGIVWSHNRGGPYVRNRAIPTNPNTARQVAVRNAMRSLTIAWDITLTQAERDAWDVYASNVTWTNRLGQTISLTGLNHYVRSNTPRVQNALARIDAAPAIFDLAAAELALSVTASAATQDLSVGFDDTADWATEVGAFQFVYCGLPQNAGVKFFKTPYRLAGVIDGEAIPTTPAIIASPFVFAEGQRIWVRTRITRLDGRLSEFAQVDFLASA